jgi:hypothetical protein
MEACDFHIISAMRTEQKESSENLNLALRHCGFRQAASPGAHAMHRENPGTVHESGGDMP